MSILKRLFEIVPHPRTMKLSKDPKGRRVKPVTSGSRPLWPRSRDKR